MSVAYYEEYSEFLDEYVHLNDNEKRSYLLLNMKTENHYIELFCKGNLGLLPTWEQTMLGYGKNDKEIFGEDRY